MNVDLIPSVTERDQNYATILGGRSMPPLLLPIKSFQPVSRKDHGYNYYPLNRFRLFWASFSGSYSFAELGQPSLHSLPSRVDKLGRWLGRQRISFPDFDQLE